MLRLRFANTNISLHAAPRGRAELFISEISFEETVYKVQGEA